MNGLIPVEYDETEIKEYMNSLYDVSARHSFDLTPVNISGTPSIYYDDIMYQMSDSFTLPAGTYNCTVTSGSYVYVPLASTTHANVKAAFPSVTDSSTSITIGYYMASGGGMNNVSLARNSTSVSTWYLVSTGYRVASSASSKKYTLSSGQSMYWFQGAKLKTPRIPNPI